MPLVQSASYTVFAVNNTGLQAAGHANAAEINADKPGVLADILKLHIIPWRLNNINIAENGAVNSMPVNGLEGPIGAPIEMPDGSILMGVIGYSLNGDRKNTGSFMLVSNDKGK